MFRKGIGSRLLELFKGNKADEEFFENLEDLLIEGDIGAVVSMSIVDQLRNNTKKTKLKDESDLRNSLRNILKGIILSENISLAEDKLNIFLVLGVNGVGKTTTIAKLANYFAVEQNAEPVLSAGDTFRAAAIDQLKMHGDRLGMRVIHQDPGADPGAVIFDTIDSVKSQGGNLILADTAGRMHNKANLVRELAKIDKIIAGRAGAVNYKKLLVIDATTGQNGLRQAEIFSEAIGIDSIVLAKYDSSAKGGIVISICRNLGIPFSFVGTGEKYGDLSPFCVNDYLDTLLG